MVAWGAACAARRPAAEASGPRGAVNMNDYLGRHVAIGHLETVCRLPQLLAPRIDSGLALPGDRVGGMGWIRYWCAARFRGVRC